MLRTIDLRGGSRKVSALRSLVPRAQLNLDQAVELVAPIVASVAKDGAKAAQEWSKKFDSVAAPQIRVPQEILDSALKNLDPQLRESLEVTIAQVRKVHQAQVPPDHEVSVIPGGTVTQRWIAVDRVGLYVPGGRAVYPSSVIMNVIPAVLAGVPSMVVASPPQLDNQGWPHPTILATCALLGITEVYAVGGAQAIALLAYGDSKLDIDPVVMVTGPGNIWVTAAKRLLKGQIGIDSEAGPTEIAILADDSADPRFVAADLISQAEHDEVAASVLVTPSLDLIDRVARELADQVAIAKHSDRIQIALSGQQSAFVLVDDVEQGIAVVDAYAAEHLEIQTHDAAAVASQIRNAGAVFVGQWSPVSLGDYAAGSNHVLPTGGCACHSSGLSVQTFLKGVHFVEYDQAAFATLAPDVIRLANAEDLPGHAAAIEVRIP